MFTGFDKMWKVPAAAVLLAFRFVSAILRMQGVELSRTFSVSRLAYNKAPGGAHAYSVMASAGSPYVQSSAALI